MKHSITTKTGDDGKTFLLGGVRIAKNHLRVKCYGDCDELNSYLGLVQSFIQHEEINSIINAIQMQIFDLSAILATPPDSMKPETDIKNSQLEQQSILYLEEKINYYEPQLPELKNFIIPGGTKGSSLLHVSRTICRRVERSVIELSQVEKVDSHLIVFFNRLSDLLFILARFENQLSGQSDIIWKSDKSK